MARANHGSLVVYDPRLLPADTVTSNSPALTSESIVGIFTERDYLLKVQTHVTVQYSAFVVGGCALLV